MSKTGCATLRRRDGKTSWALISGAVAVVMLLFVPNLAAQTPHPDDTRSQCVDEVLGESPDADPTSLDECTSIRDCAIEQNDEVRRVCFEEAQETYIQCFRRCLTDDEIAVCQGAYGRDRRSCSDFVSASQRYADEYVEWCENVVAQGADASPPALAADNGPGSEDLME